MKNQAIQYLALDVHQATTVATLRNESGAICMRATMATEAKAIVGLVKAAGKRVHVVFEEGTHAQWQHDLLTPHAERVVVWCATSAAGGARQPTRAIGSTPTGCRNSSGWAR